MRTRCVSELAMMDAIIEVFIDKLYYLAFLEEVLFHCAMAGNLVPPQLKMDKRAVCSKGSEGAVLFC